MVVAIVATVLLVTGVGDADFTRTTNSLLTDTQWSVYGMRR